MAQAATKGDNSGGSPHARCKWAVRGIRELDGRPPVLHGPKGVTLGPDGTLYVSDSGGNAIRSWRADAGWALLAGSRDGDAGCVDGAAADARFSHPVGLLVLGDRLLVADAFNHRIRAVALRGADKGAVTTIAGGGASGAARGSFADGDGPDARFNEPYGMEAVGDAEVLVCDQLNQRVRRLRLARAGHVPGGWEGGGGVDAADEEGADAGAASATCVVETAAGCGDEGARDGDAATASFFYPTCVARDAATGACLISDRANNSLRLLHASAVSTVAGGAALDAGGLTDSGTGSEARFAFPFGVAILGDGAALVADSSNHALRCVSLDGGATHTLLGDSPGSTASDGSAAISAGAGDTMRLSCPSCIAVDGVGSPTDSDAEATEGSAARSVRVYVADEDSNSIRVVQLDRVAERR